MENIGRQVEMQVYNYAEAIFGLYVSDSKQKLNENSPKSKKGCLRQPCCSNNISADPASKQNKQQTETLGPDKLKCDSTRSKTTITSLKNSKKRKAYEEKGNAKQSIQICACRFDSKSNVDKNASLKTQENKQGEAKELKCNCIDKISKTSLKKAKKEIKRQEKKSKNKNECSCSCNKHKSGWFRKTRPSSSPETTRSAKGICAKEPPCPKCTLSHRSTGTAPKPPPTPWFNRESEETLRINCFCKRPTKHPDNFENNLSSKNIYATPLKCENSGCHCCACTNGPKLAEKSLNTNCTIAINKDDATVNNLNTPLQNPAKDKERMGSKDDDFDTANIIICCKDLLGEIVEPLKLCDNKTCNGTNHPNTIEKNSTENKDTKTDENLKKIFDFTDKIELESKKSETQGDNKTKGSEKNTHENKPKENEDKNLNRSKSVRCCKDLLDGTCHKCAPNPLLVETPDDEEKHRFLKALQRGIIAEHTKLHRKKCLHNPACNVNENPC